MLGKKIVSLRKLAKKVNNATKGSGTDRRSPSTEPCKYQHRESLLSRFEDELGKEEEDEEEEEEDEEQSRRHRGGHHRRRRCPGQNSQKTPTGFVAVYVGEERQRFVVPTSYLSHPLFKMLLEKAHDEFGFRQRSGLAVPCSVAAFQEVVCAVECCNGKFDFGNLVEELL